VTALTHQVDSDAICAGVAYNPRPGH